MQLWLNHWVYIHTIAPDTITSNFIFRFFGGLDVLSSPPHPNSSKRTIPVYRRFWTHGYLHFIRSNRTKPSALLDLGVRCTRVLPIPYIEATLQHFRGRTTTQPCYFLPNPLPLFCIRIQQPSLHAFLLLLSSKCGSSCLDDSADSLSKRPH